MTDLNLRATVRAVLAGTDEPDPGVIAELVMAQIPAKQRAAALDQALRLFVRQVISETRVSRVGKVTPIVSPRSWKGQGIRDGWQRRLRDRVHVGDSAWKLLADCTYDDLMRAATERQNLADRNAAWARTYKEFALAVSEAGVDTFGDLAAERQMHLLGGAA